MNCTQNSDCHGCQSECLFERLHVSKLLSWSANYSVGSRVSTAGRGGSRMLPVCKGKERICEFGQLDQSAQAKYWAVLAYKILYSPEVIRNRCYRL